jgi:putative transposase
MITDAYTRKIVGHNTSDSMASDECKKALNMAVRGRLYPQSKLIHHSDRGLQYCSRDYVETASRAGITMSMTETSSPYDNALAERMKRTIKEEFNLNRRIKTKAEAYRAVRDAIELYNSQRPHLALDDYAPKEIHKNPQLLNRNC